MWLLLGGGAAVIWVILSIARASGEGDKSERRERDK